MGVLHCASVNFMATIKPKMQLSEEVQSGHMLSSNIEKMPYNIWLQFQSWNLNCHIPCHLAPKHPKPALRMINALLHWAGSRLEKAVYICHAPGIGYEVYTSALKSIRPHCANPEYARESMNLYVWARELWSPLALCRWGFTYWFYNNVGHER